MASVSLDHFLGSDFCNWRLPWSNLRYPGQREEHFPHRLRNVVTILRPEGRGPWHDGVSRGRGTIQVKHIARAEETTHVFICFQNSKNSTNRLCLPPPCAEPYGAWSVYYLYLRNIQGFYKCLPPSFTSGITKLNFFLTKLK